MCGHVGYLTKKATNAVTKRIFAQLLLVDQLRGKDSTGVIGIEEKDGHGWYYKRAINSTDFLQLSTWNNWASSDYKVAIGHNRAATKGTVTDNNAHPFIEGQVMLAHNGTLYNHYEMKHAPEYKDRSHIDVDSHLIAKTFSIVKDNEQIKETIESLHGAYALVWIDRRNNSLNFARNEARSFWFAMTDDTTFWASEKEMLRMVLDRNGVTKYKLKELPSGHWLTYDMDKLEDKPKLTKFTPYKAVTLQNANNRWDYGRNNNTNINGSKVTNLQRAGTRKITHGVGFKSLDGYVKGDKIAVYPYSAEYKQNNKKNNFSCYGYVLGTGVHVELYVPMSLRDELEKYMDNLNDPNIKHFRYDAIIDGLETTYKWVNGVEEAEETLRAHVLSDGIKRENKKLGTCGECDMPICEGDKVETHKGIGNFHVECLDYLYDSNIEKDKKDKLPIRTPVH